MSHELELVLHIGMGKTGSSAIQKTLRESSNILRSQKTKYTGMWLDTEERGSRPSYQDFFHADSTTWAERSRDFLNVMMEQAASDGFKTFIASNESFFHHADSFKVFVDEMRNHCDVRVCAYARNPINWLPSAYSQWGIRHKTMNGEIPAYPELAKQFVHQYETLMEWPELLGDITDIFFYDDYDDVVKHFFEYCGLPRDGEKEAFYTRSEPVESLLRALFNNRFPASVRPERYNTVIGKHVRGGVTSIDEAVGKYLDYSNTEQIVKENQHIFDRFEEVTGLNLLKGKANAKKTEDVEGLRRRLFDFVIEIVIAHSMNIRALDKRLSDFETTLEELKKK